MKGRSVSHVPLAFHGGVGTPGWGQDIPLDDEWETAAAEGTASRDLAEHSAVTWASSQRFTEGLSRFLDQYAAVLHLLLEQAEDQDPDDWRSLWQEIQAEEADIPSDLLPMNHQQARHFAELAEYASQSLARYSEKAIEERNRWQQRADEV
ncbi:hypothetical protein ACFVYD_28415 [Streptomyces sp. NPDC058301]|uniref:hypothetical protein n=1 Tax=Streptomyces sp. NPDC058301 TaxID=3346436 RepID=UPI0036EF8267